MEGFEFDPAKSRRNEEHHGVGLAWAARLWDEHHVIFKAKDVAGENRCLILAKVEGVCYMAVFVRRGRALRIITCHRADERLRRLYAIWVEAAEA